MAQGKAGTLPAPKLAADPAAIRAQFAEMAKGIPDAPEDGGLGIVAQIMEAGSVDSLDDPWRTRDMEKLAGERITVYDLHKLPSDFKDGLGVYLVVHAVRAETGEDVTVTTGSVSVVAQLVRAWAMGALPITVIPRIADRPSRNGYYPQHLEIVRD